MNDKEPHVSPHFIAGMRLGNIMFAVATVYAHALRNDVPCRVPWAYNDASMMLHDYLKHEPALLPSTPFGANESMRYREPRFSFCKIPADVLEGGICGYFQSSRYFADQKEAIRELFKPFIAEKQPGTLGIHFRLGDYKHQQHKFHVVDRDFLARAYTHISPEIKHLVVFSDEPDAAAEIIAGIPEYERFTIEVDRNSPCDAIRRMTAMQELIISASSFSWWGAWLGETQRVIAPSKWFNGDIYDYQDIYEPHWVKL